MIITFVSKQNLKRSTVLSCPLTFSMSSPTVILNEVSDEISSKTDQPLKDVEVIDSLKCLSTSASKIATLVFFDTETTGLAFTVGKRNVQITEISLIAVDRNEFSVCQFADLRDIRIVHKMSLCIRPNCCISRESENLTGLTDQNLKNQEPFDANTANALIAFLSHLAKPVALLAHNGKTFDFPILKSEFLKLGMQLPHDIYVIDTLSAIRRIGIPSLPSDQTMPEGIKLKKDGNISYSLENLHRYFYGKIHFGNHSSEGDCIALAKVCYKLKDKMLPWMDDNLQSFDSISPMW